VTIRDERDLDRSQRALMDLYRSLVSLRSETRNAAPHAFAVLAEGPLQEARRIRRELDEFTGILIAERDEAPLWMTLEGGRVQWGEASASVVIAYLGALRKAIQSIAGFIATGKLARKPTSDLLRACDPELVAFAPGSLAIGLRLPEPEHSTGELRGAWRSAKSGLDELLVVAAWAARSDSHDTLASSMPDPRQRLVSLRAVRDLVPSPSGGVDYVEFSGRAIGASGPIRLTRAAAFRIQTAIGVDSPKRELRLEGVIRQLDLDKHSFVLREVEQVGAVRCDHRPRFDALAKEMLGRRVRVVGVGALEDERVVGHLEVSAIEPA
jgi:hypothetical protein